METLPELHFYGDTYNIEYHVKLFTKTETKKTTYHPNVEDERDSYFFITVCFMKPVTLQSSSLHIVRVHLALFYPELNGVEEEWMSSLTSSNMPLLRTRITRLRHWLMSLVFGRLLGIICILHPFLKIIQPENSKTSTNNDIVLDRVGLTRSHTFVKLFIILDKFTFFCDQNFQTFVQTR